MYTVGDKCHGPGRETLVLLGYDAVWQGCRGMWRLEETPSPVEIDQGPGPVEGSLTPQQRPAPLWRWGADGGLVGLGAPLEDKPRPQPKACLTGKDSVHAARCHDDESHETSSASRKHDEHTTTSQRHERPNMKSDGVC